jgi:transposase
MDETDYTERRVYTTYPEPLKRAVVKEYETTNCSRAYLKRKFGLNNTNVIKWWVKKYGEKEYLTRPNAPNPLSMASPKESLEIQTLKQRIKQLERELEDAKILSEAYSLMIQKAEEQLKIPIRKKCNTK